MKTPLLFALVVVLPIAVLTAQDRAAADPEVQLRAAMTRELLHGDLAGAIAEYRRIAADAAASRSLAARALFQLAQAYEKQGDPEARATYERLTRTYRDQPGIAAQANVRLQALGQVAPASASPFKRLLVDHRDGRYGRPTRDGRSYLRYDPERRGFELLDFATGRARRITTDGPSPADAAVGTAQLSNDGRRIAATVHVHRPGTRGNTQADIVRAEIRVFDVDGRGPGRVIASWPMEQLIRFSARPFAWAPRNDRVWLKVMFRDLSAQIVAVDLAGAQQTVKTMPWHDHSQPPSLSPDGRFVTYHDAFDRQAPPDIVILAADGSREERLRNPANDNKPMFTPDGSGIVFESNRRGPRDLWFVPVANGRPAGEARLVWRDVGAFGEVQQFAASGALVYYFAANEYSVSTVPIDVDGGRAAIGERSPVPTVAGEMNTGAAFSPDGRELAFFRARGRRVALRSVESGREREFPLGIELGINATLDWCPGGTRLMAAGSVPGSGNVAYSIDLQDSAVRRLPLPEPVAVVCLGPEEALYLRNVGPQRQSLLRRDLATGAESLLFTGDRIGGRSLARSADRSRIAFVETDTRGSRLRVLSLEAGASPVTVMDAGAPIDGQVPLIQNVAWMSDGRRLLVVRLDEEFAGQTGQTQRPLWLWEVPADGGASRRIGTLPVTQVEGYFAGLSSLTVHTGGTQIAYQSHERYVEQTWAIENLARAIREDTLVR